MDKDLSKFAQEPRDPPWSSEVERRLRDYLGTEPGKYAIRNVECRTSLCAVEVASIYSQLSPTSSGTALDSCVIPGGSEFGYERDVSSAKTIVTVMIFWRRQ